MEYIKNASGKNNYSNVHRMLGVLMFLVAFNFFEKASLIFTLVTIFFFFVFSHKLHYRYDIDTKAFLLILFSINACAVSLIFYTPHQVLQSLVFALAFIIGKMSYQNAKNKEIYVKNTLVIIILGYGFNILVNYIYNYLNNPRIGERVVFSIWTGQQILVTYWAPVALILSGGIYYTFKFEKRISVKAGVLFCTIGTILFGLKSATRTMVFSVFLLPFICYLVSKLDWLRNREYSHIKLKNIIWMLIGIVVCFLMLIFWGNEVSSFVENSAFFNRFKTSSIMDSGRDSITQYYLENLILYPFGGEFVSYNLGRYAHNLYMETYDSYGVIGFVIIVIFLCSCIKDLFLYITRKRTSYGYLYVGIVTAFLILSLIEPCLHSNISIVWVNLFMLSLISSQMKKELKGN